MVPADNWDIKGNTLANVPTSSLNFMAKLENIKLTIYGLLLHFTGVQLLIFFNNSLIPSLMLSNFVVK